MHINLANRRALFKKPTANTEYFVRIGTSKTLATRDIAPEYSFSYDFLSYTWIKAPSLRLFKKPDTFSMMMLHLETWSGYGTVSHQAAR